jgi:AcrR family transcriptional regulator
VPKVVDHEERRREIAGAAWRVILRDGVEGVSIRDVAAEAGMSTGALRHYFATKEDLLAGGARLVVERVSERLARRPEGKTPNEVVGKILREVLPLDEGRRTEGAVWLAFVARGQVDRRVAEEHEVVFDGLRGLCRGIVERLHADGWLAPGLDPEQEAWRLHALVDGLCVHGLMGRLDADEMLGVLDAHLDGILRASRKPPG